jgi:hypothetical protein
LAQSGTNGGFDAVPDNIAATKNPAEAGLS